MTNQGIEDRPRPDDDDRPAKPQGDDERARPAKPEEKSPWLREGADAPDAADIESPEEQR